MSRPDRTTLALGAGAGLLMVLSSAAVASADSYVPTAPVANSGVPVSVAPVSITRAPTAAKAPTAGKAPTAAKAPTTVDAATTVRSTAPASLPYTGSDMITGGAIAGIALVAAGGTFVIAGRRRRVS